MFIAPNLAIPYHAQLLDLQRRHSVVSLTSDVTRRLIHEEADRGKPFQVVHILVDDAIAFNESERSRLVIQLPGGEVLDGDAVNYILKRAGGASLFCNSCFGAALAANAVYTGSAPWAVGNTLRINNSDAWIGPSAFYSALADQSVPDSWAAFRAIPPDLYYAHFINLDDVSVISARPVYKELTAMLAKTTEVNSIMTELRGEWQKLEVKSEQNATKIAVDLADVKIAATEAATALKELRNKTRLADIRQILLIAAVMVVLILANTGANIWQHYDIARLYDLMANLASYWIPGVPMRP